MSDDLENLLEADILHLAGLEDAPPDVKEHALADAKDYILRAVVQRIRNRVSPELQKEFERLFGGEEDRITEEDNIFIKEYVPDLDTLILEETLAFKKGVMDAAEEIKRKFANESQKINGILNDLKE